MPNKESAIGVFHSGIGGLTVLDKIIETLPNENRVYLGDTVRGPYGDCTPYPLLKRAIRSFYGNRRSMVDSAEETENEVESAVKKQSLIRESGKGVRSFFVTDTPDRFVKVGRRLLGEKVESAVRIKR